MTIRIKLFAGLADAVQRCEVELEIARESTLDDVWNRLTILHPALIPFSRSLLKAVNQEFGQPDTVVRDGDEVAFFPPVSGG